MRLRNAKIKKKKLIQIKADNFKSFKKINLKLNDYNVFIGANASGKTNLINLFEFIGFLKNDVIENAVQLQGGKKYFLNFKTRNNKFTLNLKFQLNSISFYGLFYFEDQISIFDNIKYKLKLTFENNEISNVYEKLIYNAEYNKEYYDGYYTGYYTGYYYNSYKFSLIIEKKEKDTIIEIKAKSKEDKSLNEEIKKFFEKLFQIKRNFGTTLLQDNLMFIDNYLNIGCYEINPKTLKKFSSPKGKVVLEKNGENLGIILQKILNDKKKNNEFFNYLTYILPFIKDLKVEEIDEDNLKISLKESYSNSLIPAVFSSDGTIYIIAVIIILYFEKKDLIILEEPERYIHPYLISKLMQMIKDASKTKQIIITTHSPEIVKNTDPDNLFLISRDKKGYSQISKPIDKDDIKIFMQNEIGLDEIFVQNLFQENN